VRAGLEVQTRTAPIASDPLKIGHQLATGTGGTLGLVSHQVVYVKTAPDVSILEVAEDRDADDPIGTHRQAHFATVAKDTSHLFRIIRRQLRAQLPVHAFCRK
jgi:hypothetical protein